MEKKTKIKFFVMFLLVISSCVSCNTDTAWIVTGNYAFEEYWVAKHEDPDYENNIAMLKDMEIEINTDTGDFILMRKGQDKIERKLSGLSMWTTDCQPNDVDIEHRAVSGGPIILSDTMTIETPIIKALSCSDGGASEILLLDQTSRTIKFDDGSYVDTSYAITFKSK